MRPQNDIHLSPADRVAVATWSRGTIGACVLIGVAILALATIGRESDRTYLAAHAETKPLAPICQQWHEAASGAVTQLLRSTRDVDLRQVGDAVFRMRRARRNCEAGWLNVACQDYRAVAHSSTGGPTAGFGGTPLGCMPANSESTGAVARQSWPSEQ